MKDKWVNKYPIIIGVKREPIRTYKHHIIDGSVVSQVTTVSNKC